MKPQLLALAVFVLGASRVADAAEFSLEYSAEPGFSEVYGLFEGDVSPADPNLILNVRNVVLETEGLVFTSQGLDALGNTLSFDGLSNDYRAIGSGADAQNIAFVIGLGVVLPRVGDTILFWGDSYRSRFDSARWSVNAVPEPATGMLLCIGLTLLSRVYSPISHGANRRTRE